MGISYAFDGGATNGPRSMISGLLPGNENEFDGLHHGLEFMLGGWSAHCIFDATISPEGIFSWNAIANAGSYRVYAFEYGRQFARPAFPSGVTGFSASLIQNADQSVPGLLHVHTPPAYVTIETFHLTNNTRLMSEMACAYVDTTATSFDITRMGLRPGVEYVFRVQALAPANQGPPTPHGVTATLAVDKPFNNSLLSGVTFAAPNAPGFAYGTDFPSFVIEARLATVVNCWYLHVRTGPGAGFSAFNHLVGAQHPTRPAHTVNVLETRGNWHNIEIGRAHV